MTRTHEPLLSQERRDTSQTDEAMNRYNKGFSNSHPSLWQHLDGSSSSAEPAGSDGGTAPTLSLFELNGLVRQTIEQVLDREYWVEAELSECRENNGHCYMELVEKDARGNTPIARAQAKCWRSTWSMVRPHFERITGQQMHAGMKVKLKVYPQFHEAYGFSWIVTDIDPTFTLGDLARRRQEIVRQLKEEGVFDLQRELPLPLFCQRIAVISAPTAAGYGDFTDELLQNPYGLAFAVKLFPAVMQGEQVEQSIIDALNQIYASATGDAGDTQAFDCVVIIRGGGSTSDLSGFDTLALAENVAQFPLPVITGIGHDRDESVLDMVSHTRVKTPTAAADFLIDHLRGVQQRVDSSEERLLHHVQQAMEMERMRLGRLAERIPPLFSLVSTRQQARLDSLTQQLTAAIDNQLQRQLALLPMFHTRLAAATARVMLEQQHRLQLLQQRTASLDPAILLRRGYSITLHNGKALTDSTLIAPGDEIETRLSQGSLRSTVTLTAVQPPAP